MEILIETRERFPSGSRVAIDFPPPDGRVIWIDGDCVNDAEAIIARWKAGELRAEPTGGRLRHQPHGGLVRLGGRHLLAEGDDDHAHRDHGGDHEPHREHHDVPQAQ